MKQEVVSQDFSKLQLSESESDLESPLEKKNRINSVLGSLGIHTTPYRYVLDYFDNKSISPCFLCDQQFEQYAFALEHLKQAHFLTISQVEHVIDVPL
jgi:hypothetical protein